MIRKSTTSSVSVYYMLYYTTRTIMKKTALTISIIALAATTFAAPFVTSRMMLRNGLTDEQYEYLWSMGKNPQIEQSAARQWIYRASRYDNVIEWLNDLGKTNDFAKLAARLSTNNVALAERIQSLVATNGALSSAIGSLQTLSDEYFANWTNSYARAELAEKRAAAVKSALTEKREEYVEKRDDAKLSTTKSIYQAFIDIIDGIIVKFDEDEEETK
jgi:hypothetical protein